MTIESVDIRVAHCSNESKNKNDQVSAEFKESRLHHFDSTDGRQHSHAFETTLTRTSPALGGITMISSSTNGCFGARATIALHLIGFPSVDMFDDFLVFDLCLES